MPIDPYGYNPGGYTPIYNSDQISDINKATQGFFDTLNNINKKSADTTIITEQLKTGDPVVEQAVKDHGMDSEAVNAAVAADKASYKDNLPAAERNFDKESTDAITALFGDKYGGDIGKFAFEGTQDEWRQFLNYANIKDWYADAGIFDDNGNFLDGDDGFNDYWKKYREEGDISNVFTEGYGGSNADVVRKYFDYMVRNDNGWNPSNAETQERFKDLLERDANGHYTDKSEEAIKEQVDNLLYEYAVYQAERAWQLAQEGDPTALNTFKNVYGGDLENLNKFINKDVYKFVNNQDTGADVERFNEFAEGVDPENYISRLANGYYEPRDKSYNVPVSGGLDILAYVLGEDNGYAVAKK